MDSSRIESPKIGRPAVKQTQIVGEIVAQIVAGELVPGSRLATRREIASKYGASVPTVQNALNQLITDGFVVARGTLGTFVAARPPHLAHYALVFPNTLGELKGWSQFWTALEHEAARLGKQRHRKISVFHGIDGHRDNEDFQTLARAVVGKKLAGLMFASPPFLVRDTVLMDEPGIPRVAISVEDEADVDVRIELDGESFLTKALDELARCGRKRVGFVTGPPPVIHFEKLEGMLKARAMSSEVYWMQSATPQNPACVRNIMRLMFHSGQKERPDALIITDDHLVGHATAGLLEAGMRVPADVEVIAHCNFPWPLASVTPVKRLGYDARTVLAMMLDAVDEVRTGTRERVRFVPAVFEDEVEVANGSLTVVGK